MKLRDVKIPWSFFWNKLKKNAKIRVLKFANWKTKPVQTFWRCFSSGPYIEKFLNLARMFLRVPRNNLYANFGKIRLLAPLRPLEARKGPETLKMCKTMKIWSYRQFVIRNRMSLLSWPLGVTSGHQRSIFDFYLFFLIFVFSPLVTPGDLGWPQMAMKAGSFDSLWKTYMTIFSWVLHTFNVSGHFLASRGRKGARSRILPKFAYRLFLGALRNILAKFKIFSM